MVPSPNSPPFNYMGLEQMQISLINYLNTHSIHADTKMKCAEAINQWTNRENRNSAF